MGEEPKIKCPFCGEALGADFEHCVYCGRAVPEFYRAREARGFADTFPVKYGGFWIRLAAALVDVLIIGAVMVVLLIFWPPVWEIWLWFVYLALIIVYPAIFLAWKAATPGKLLYGLFVVKAKTLQRVSAGRAFGRSLAFLVSLLTVPLSAFGFWMAAASRFKRTVHDRIAGTLVLRKKSPRPFIAGALTTIALIAFAGLGYLLFTTEDYGYFGFLPKREAEIFTQIEERYFGQPDFMSPLLAAAGEEDPGLWAKQVRFGQISRPKNRSAREIIEEQGEAVVMIAGYTAWGEQFFGSGFIVAPTGLIVTNNHVVADAGKAAVVTIGGEIYDVNRVLILDEQHDLAVIGIEAESLPVVTLGDSDKVAIGEEIIAVGNPEGFSNTVSDGIVSSLRDFDYEGLRLQITAPISSGSSGGPLYNMAGEVIGVTESMIVGLGAQNLNFGIPINYLRELLE